MKTLSTLLLCSYALALAAALCGPYADDLVAWVSSPFGLALAAGFGSTYLLFRPYGFAAVLKHEIAHSLAAVMTFNRPVALQVKSDGSGLAEHRGTHNWFICLAPYFLPVMALPLLLIGCLGIASGTGYAVLLGLAAGFDLGVSWRQFGYHQVDLLHAGKVRSTLLVASCATVCYTFVIAFAGAESPRIAITVLKTGAGQLAVWAHTAWVSVAGLV